MSEISEIKDLLVQSMKEQQVIASKIDSLDTKIDKVQFYLEKEIAGSLKIALNEQDELAEQINAIGEQSEKTENNLNKFKSSFLDMTMEWKLKVVPA